MAVREGRLKLALTGDMTAVPLVRASVKTFDTELADAPPPTAGRSLALDAPNGPRPTNDPRGCVGVRMVVMSDLQIRRRSTGPVTILSLEGRIALGDGSSTLRAAVGDLVDAGSKKILLDLAGVTFLDSSGLGELVSAYARVQRFGGELKLVNLVPRVYGLLEMTKLVTVFETFASEPDALRSFANVSATRASR